MKNQAIKIAIWVAVTGFSGVTLAHDTGPQTLGATVGAHDIYRAECFSWANGIHPVAPAGEANGAANKLQAQITSVTAGNPATIRIQALPSGAKVGFGATSTSLTGNGLHYFIVSHTAAGGHAYVAQFHCFNAAGTHTGTGYNFIGNPPTVTPSVDFVRTLNQ